MYQSWVVHTVKYWLLSLSTGETSARMRVCGLRNWSGFMVHCDNVTADTRSCYCTSDYCNGPNPKLLKEKEDNSTLIEFTNATSALNETEFSNISTTILTTDKVYPKEKESFPLPMMLHLIKSMYTKTVGLLKSLW